MSESVAEQHSSNHKWIIGVSLASALAAGIVGFLIYSAVCPCERTPGGFLFGAAADGPVDDWSLPMRSRCVSYRSMLGSDLIRSISTAWPPGRRALPELLGV